MSAELSDWPEKRLANARARAALNGATLHRIEDDRGDPVFVVTRWAHTRQLQSIEAVEAWLDRLEGGRRAGLEA